MALASVTVLVFLGMAGLGSGWAHPSVAHLPGPKFASATTAALPPPLNGAGHINGQRYLAGGFFEGPSALDPTLGLLFVPNGFGGLTVVNTSTNTRTSVVHTGVTAPVAALYDPQTDRVYLSDAWNDSLAILNPHTLAVVGYMTGFAGSGPMLLLNSTGDILLAGNGPFPALYIFDPVASYFFTLGFYNVTSMAEDDATDVVLLSGNNGTADFLTTYDDLTFAIGPVLVTPTADAVGYDGAAGKFVAMDGNGNVTVYPGINVTASGIGTPLYYRVVLPYDGAPSAIAFDPLTRAMVISRQLVSGPNIYPYLDSVVLSPGGVVVKGSVPTGEHPIGAVFDAANGNLYVPEFFHLFATSATSGSAVNVRTYSFQFPSNSFATAHPLYVPTVRQFWSQGPFSTSIHIVSEKTHAYLGSFSLGYGFNTLYYDPANNEVVGSSGGYLVAINVTTHNSTLYNYGNVGLGGLVYDPYHGTLVVDDGAYNSLLVVNASTFGLVANLSTSSGAWGGTFDPETNTVLVADFGGNITIVNGGAKAGELVASYAGDQVVYDPVTHELYEPTCTGVSMPAFDALTYAAMPSVPGVYQQLCSASSGAYDPGDRMFVDFGNGGGGSATQNGIMVNARGQLAMSIFDTYTRSANIGGIAIDPLTNQIVVSASDAWYWVNP